LVHHSNGAAITELATGYPGYDGNIPFENGFLSEMLGEHGYNTYMVGKWHLMPSEQESAAGPYDRWPLGRGFDRFYGFLGGDTSQWYPELVYDNHMVEPPRSPQDGYHLSVDLADHAISFVADAKQVAPDKPFFLLAATHAPHHVPKEWADRYAGQFDAGWDAYREEVFARQKELGIIPVDAELSRHDPDVPEWDSLAPEARRLAARMMEVYAGFLTHADAQIGRLLDFLRTIGELDNTLVMLVSDNGAGPEGGRPAPPTRRSSSTTPRSYSLAKLDELGGPKTFNHYPWGWTWAGNTPFRRWKRETYRGGASDPFIVNWPAGIAARGEIREQYVHIIDMVPTVLDVLGLEAPAAIRGVTQSPLHGVSFAHTFADADAATRHHTQYFEIIGHRAIDLDGWRAVCPWPGPSFAEADVPFGTPITADVPAIYVDNDAALLAGRELGGYPKKMAQITMRNYGDLFLSHMARGAIQKKTADPNFEDLASSCVSRAGKLVSVPLPADETVELPPPYNMLLPLPPPTGEPQDYVLMTIALRHFPGIGPGPNGSAGAEVLQLVGTPWHITKAEIYAGDAASMELFPSEGDPIGRLLPCNAVLGAFVLQGDMSMRSDEWVLIEDLKKNKAQ
jgi:arylsulfatase A-like enzyme